MAQASIRPMGQKENAHLCPRSGPGGVSGWSDCPHRVPRARLPTVQRGHRAGVCVSVPSLCSGHAALDRVRPKGPATGRPPASPVFYLDLFLPPKPARSRPGRGSRTSCSAPPCRAQTGRVTPVPARLGAGAWCSAGKRGRTSACCGSGTRAVTPEGGGARVRAWRGLGPLGAPLGPWLLWSSFTPQEVPSLIVSPELCCWPGQEGPEGLPRRTGTGEVLALSPSWRGEVPRQPAPYITCVA